MRQFATFILTTIFAISSMAAPARQAESLRVAGDLYDLFKNVSTLGFLVREMPRDYRERNKDYIQSLLKKYEMNPLPRFKIKGDTLYLVSERREDSFKVIDPEAGIYSINRHPYQFSAEKPLEITVSEIQELLKGHREVSLRDLFYSEADAQAVVILLVLAALAITAFMLDSPLLVKNFKRASRMAEVLRLCQEFLNKVKDHPDVKLRDMGFGPLTEKSATLLKLFDYQASLEKADGQVSLDSMEHVDFERLRRNYDELQKHDLCADAQKGLIHPHSGPVCQFAPRLMECLGQARDAAGANLKMPVSGAHYPSGDH